MNDTLLHISQIPIKSAAAIAMAAVNGTIMRDEYHNRIVRSAYSLIASRTEYGVFEYVTSHATSSVWQFKGVTLRVAHK